ADKTKQWGDALGGFFGEQNAFGPKPTPQQNPFFQQLLAQDPAQAKTVAELYTPEKPQDTRPADVKEYEFYSQQEAGAGRSPASFNEWRLQRAKASAPVTNVSTSVGGQKVPDNVINASLKALEESNAMEEQVQDITNF